MSENDPEAAEDVIQEFEAEAAEKIQELIEQANKNGIEIPERLRKHIQSSKYGKQFDIDARLLKSKRERDKAKKAHDDK